MSHRISIVAVSALAVLLAAPAFAAGDADNKNCKIVERDASKSPNDGTLSSSVTAGGGRVSAQTSGGNSVTMSSGNGSVSSSISTTGSGGRSQTVTTNSDGSCTIYRDKEK
jgi:hypothetical protein